MSELLERTFEKGGTYFVSPQLSICPHISHAFFSRQGGVSKGIFDSLNFRYTGGDNEKDIARNYAIAACWEFIIPGVAVRWAHPTAAMR